MIQKRHNFTSLYVWLVCLYFVFPFTYSQWDTFFTVWYVGGSKPLRLTGHPVMQWAIGRVVSRPYFKRSKTNAPTHSAKKVFSNFFIWQFMEFRRWMVWSRQLVGFVCLRIPEWELKQKNELSRTEWRRYSYRSLSEPTATLHHDWAGGKMEVKWLNSGCLERRRDLESSCLALLVGGSGGTLCSSLSE